LLCVDDGLMDDPGVLVRQVRKRCSVAEKWLIVEQSLELSGPGVFEPVEMLVFGKIDGPGFSIPVRGLVLGLFLFQSDRA
jgi:hypothetical protein